MISSQLALLQVLTYFSLVIAEVTILFAMAFEKTVWVLSLFGKFGQII